MKREHELTEAERERAWMVVSDVGPAPLEDDVLLGIVVDLMRKFGQ